MNFSLTLEQEKTFNHWARQFVQYPTGVSGGAFTYSFTPTTIGVVVKIKHFTGAELDVTEWDKF